MKKSGSLLVRVTNLLMRYSKFIIRWRRLYEIANILHLFPIGKLDISFYEGKNKNSRAILNEKMF